MVPTTPSHGDGTLGAGAEDCITNARRLCQVDLGSRPRLRPTRRRVFCTSFPPISSGQTVSGCLLGGYPVGRDQWGGKRTAGGMSEDNDRCFSTLVLGAFSTGVFNTIALPRINIGTDVWVELSIMTGVFQRSC
jgi:hypothetical protein